MSLVTILSLIFLALFTPASLSSAAPEPCPDCEEAAPPPVLVTKTQDCAEDECHQYKTVATPFVFTSTVSTCRTRKPHGLSLYTSGTSTFYVPHCEPTTFTHTEQGGTCKSVLPETVYESVTLPGSTSVSTCTVTAFANGTAALPAQTFTLTETRIGGRKVETVTKKERITLTKYANGPPNGTVTLISTYTQTRTKRRTGGGGGGKGETTTVYANNTITPTCPRTRAGRPAVKTVYVTISLEASVDLVGRTRTRTRTPTPAIETTSSCSVVATVTITRTRGRTVPAEAPTCIASTQTIVGSASTITQTLPGSASTTTIATTVTQYGTSCAPSAPSNGVTVVSTHIRTTTIPTIQTITATVSTCASASASVITSTVFSTIFQTATRPGQTVVSSLPITLTTRLPAITTYATITQGTATLTTTLRVRTTTVCTLKA